MKPPKYIYIIILSLGVLGIFLITHLMKLPGDTLFLRELNNTGHTFLFGAMSLLVLGVVRTALKNRLMRSSQHYWLALIITGGIGVLSESLQYAGPRDADAVDLLRDIAGAVSFLSVHWWFMARSGDKEIDGKRNHWWLAAGVLVFLGSMVPLCLWGGAYAYRNSAFPIIADCESYWGNRFLKPRDADLSFIPSFAEDTTDKGNRAVRIDFDTVQYSGIVIAEPYPDWSEYESFCFELYSPLPDTIALEFRINDATHDNSFSDRYNTTLTAAPGLNRYEVSLDDVRLAPRSREMDMSNIIAIMLFAENPARPFAVYLDNLYLKK